jgi:high-affinity nickel permease
MLSIVLPALALGLLHSLEPDHIVAVSTIVARCKNVVSSVFAGVFWGVGHASVIILASLAVFYTKGFVSGNILAVFEFFVGVMLVYLGVRLAKSALAPESSPIHDHSHDHSTTQKPVISLLIGSLHGLAGSGAVIALFFSDFSSITQSLVSVVSFGIGTIISMALASSFLGLSLHYYRLGRFGSLEKYVQIGIGSVAILLGIYKMIGIVV